MWELIRCKSDEEAKLLSALRTAGANKEAIQNIRNSYDAEFQGRSIAEKESISREVRTQENNLKQTEIKRRRRETNKATCEAKIAAKVAEIEEAKAKLAKAKVEKDVAEGARLAAEGRRSALAAWGISRGVLTVVEETELEKIINDQTKSVGSGIRIESGDGK